MPLAPDYWLSQQIRALWSAITNLQNTPVLANSSSDGVNGWMKISNGAVNQQPAIEFHYTGGGGDLLAQIYETTAGAIQITGGLQVSGPKSFVMTHPLHPGSLLRHASTESPVNGVEYWGTATLDSSGNATVTLPDYFEALTKPGNRIVQLTAMSAPASLAYEPIVNGAFVVHGPSGTPFSWLAKAERASQPGDWPIDFAAEEQGLIPGPPVTDKPATPAPPSLMTADPTPDAAPAPAPTPAPTPAPAPAA